MRAHVLICITSYVTDDDPINGAIYRQHLRQYRAKGWHVGLVAVSQKSSRRLQLVRRSSLVSWDNEAGAPVLKNYAHNGLLSVVLRGIRRLKLSSKPAALRSSGMQAVEDYVQRYGRPDLIHAHGTLAGPGPFGPGQIAHAVYYQHGIPYVLTEHITKFLREDSRTPRRTKRARPAVEGAALRMPVSSALGRRMEANFGEAMRPWTTVPNIVDDRFLRLPLTLRNDGKFIVFSVSNLTRKKRPDILIRAFAEAFAGQPAELRIGGDGPELEAIKSLVQQLGVASQVSLLGSLSRENVAREMEGCSVCALSSEVETFGIPVIEAMAAGKPVVATRCGGPDDLIDDSNGHLVEVGSVSDFASALVAVRDELGQYDPEVIRKKCEARFSANAVLAKLEEIYDRYGSSELNAA